MTLNLSAPGGEHDLKPRITVMGVGGAGTNAVSNMIKSNLEGVDFVVANTDAQSLAQSHCERRIQLGLNITHGLGAGARPDIGRAAAEEAMETIADHLQGSHMAFIAAGMGGATGTGAGPVIARVAREQGILTVGVVTKPFHFEGQHRMRIAEEGLAELQQFVDTLIVIPNQNLFRVANEKTTFADAFKMADNVLYSGVRGVTDLIVMPGLINLDFADIRTVMAEMGKAMMGTGEASSERRAIEASESAISNPLLEDVSMKGAKGLLINITGGLDMTLFEVDEAANRIRDEVDPDANIIFGSTFDESMEGVMRVSIVATGIEAEDMAMTRPAHLSLVQATAHSAVPAETAGSAPEPVAEPMTEPVAEPVVAEAAAPVMAAAPMAAGNAAVAVAATPEGMVEVVAETAPEPPSAETANRPFIAPRPLEPKVQRAAPKAADPFAAAAMTNGGTPERRRGGRSLFQKVTSAALGRRDEAPAASQPAATTPPAPKAARSEPVMTAPKPAAPAPAPTPAAAPAAVEPTPEPTPKMVVQPSVQATLEELAPAEPPAGSHEPDDLLEIPAFLRRQAN